MNRIFTTIWCVYGIMDFRIFWLTNITKPKTLQCCLCVSIPFCFFCIYGCFCIQSYIAAVVFFSLEKPYVRSIYGTENQKGWTPCIGNDITRYFFLHGSLYIYNQGKWNIRVELEKPASKVAGGALVGSDQQPDSNPYSDADAQADPDTDSHTSIEQWKLSVFNF